ncbi:hypothetical protein CHS0354_036557 [Potamilus streckersoni]|uniref:Uncharacterized protein n=1 Tax=Potamilus streckersoni TaxID=2493646 RepID=A0AAE0SXT9_9BIVA|nr:hypothetical protein CHS0354_036557 [Potamilus streckersoni]
MNRRPGIYWCNLSCCGFAAHIFLPALGVIGIKVPSRSNSVPKFGKQAEEAAPGIWRKKAMEKVRRTAKGEPYTPGICLNGSEKPEIR